jgi:hypothetical protein
VDGGAEFVDPIAEALAVVFPAQIVAPDGYTLASRELVKERAPVLSFTAALNEVFLGKSTVQTYVVWNVLVTRVSNVERSPGDTRL